MTSIEHGGYMLDACRCWVLIVRDTHGHVPVGVGMGAAPKNHIQYTSMTYMTVIGMEIAWCSPRMYIQ